MDASTSEKHALAIECSGRRGSVTVGCGDDVLDTIVFEADSAHAAELLPAMDQLCKDVGIQPDALAHCYVSGGPGSFTGVRLGATVGRALALAGGVKLVRVPTLDVVAQNALEADNAPANVGVVLDAKRNRVFAAAFVLREGAYARVCEPAERDPAEFLDGLGQPAAVLGEGVPYIEPAIEACDVRPLDASLFRARSEVVYRLGRGMARRGEFMAAVDFVPIYVRRPEAEEVWIARHGGAGAEGSS